MFCSHIGLCQDSTTSISEEVEVSIALPLLLILATNKNGSSQGIREQAGVADFIFLCAFGRARPGPVKGNQRRAM